MRFSLLQGVARQWDSAQTVLWFYSYNKYINVETGSYSRNKKRENSPALLLFFVIFRSNCNTCFI